MQANPTAMLAKMTFKAAMTPMPFQYKFPQDMQQYSQAFSLKEKMGMINPTWLFMALSTNSYHTAAAALNSAMMSSFIDDTIAAVCGAVDEWSKMATVVNAKVMAISCIGQPGCLKAPPMEPLILKSAPMDTPQRQKYSKAIAKAVGKAWDNWAKNVTIPGLPWYPAFAAFPGPMAPPTPNIPVPLLLLPSSGMADLVAPKLAKAMEDALGDKKAHHQKALFNAIGTAVGTMFLAWLPTVQVMNVLGTGPIPTFAPPFVPVGPVVNGMANGAPGCLMSPPSGAAALKKPKDDSEQKKIEQQVKQAEQKAKQLEQEAEQAMKKLEQDVKAAQKG